MISSISPKEMPKNPASFSVFIIRRHITMSSRSAPLHPKKIPDIGSKTLKLYRSAPYTFHNRLNKLITV